MFEPSAPDASHYLTSNCVTLGPLTSNAAPSPDCLLWVQCRSLEFFREAKRKALPAAEFCDVQEWKHKKYSFSRDDVLICVDGDIYRRYVWSGIVWLNLTVFRVFQPFGTLELSINVSMATK